MQANQTGNVVLLKSVSETSTPPDLSNVYELCKFVQSEIRASKMKYKDIASKAHCAPQTVARIADGTTKDPRIGTVIRILFVLGRRLSIV